MSKKKKHGKPDKRAVLSRELSTSYKTSDNDSALPAVVSRSAYAPSLSPEQEVNAEILRDFLGAMKDDRREMQQAAIRAAISPGTYKDSWMAPGPLMGGQVVAFDHPWNYVTPQPPHRKPGSAITTDTLRLLADNYDVMRACIGQLQREVTSAPFQIVPVDPHDDSPSTKAIIAEMEFYFQDPKGGLGGMGIYPWQFQVEWIEDLLVIGACAIHHWNTFGGTPYMSRAVAADTIRPIVDGFGWPPYADDQPAFEQWISGIRCQQMSRQEFDYVGIWKKTTSPYFTSPVEWLITTTRNALNADQWNSHFLTDGNTPDMLIACPPDWTPSMMKEYASYFDRILSGEMRDRRKAKLVPGGTKTVEPASRKDSDFQEMERWMARRTCAIFGVSPPSIGIMDDQYKATVGESMQQTSAFGTGTILLFRRFLYTERLRAHKVERIVRIQDVTDTYETPLQRATRNQIRLAGGWLTSNEARRQDGLPPMPDGDTLMIQSSMIPLHMAISNPNIPTGIGQTRDKKDNNAK